jgi:chitodextrinase
MRTTLCFAIVVGVTVFASAQTASAPKSNWLADSVTRNGDVMQMDGHVKIAACAVITADHAVGGPNTTDTEISGNVHVRLTEEVDPLR